LSLAVSIRPEIAAARSPPAGDRDANPDLQVLLLANQHEVKSLVGLGGA
jgi:hypothetical protein